MDAQMLKDKVAIITGAQLWHGPDDGGIVCPGRCRRGADRPGQGQAGRRGGGHPGPGAGRAVGVVADVTSRSPPT